MPSLFERTEQWQQSDTAKTVAIVVGGAAALGFGLFFLKLIMSWIKKDDGKVELQSSVLSFPLFGSIFLASFSLCCHFLNPL